MKKWMYVISVGSMLAVFLFFYFAHLKESKVREEQHQAEAAKKAADEAAHKAKLEEQARVDATAKATARAAEEAKKEADKQAKWDAAGLEIKNTTDGYNAEADKFSKEASALDVQLDKLRNDKEALNRETFELAKRVEQAKINRQNAELSIQRTTEMIANRAADSSLTRMPPPAPVPAKS